MVRSLFLPTILEDMTDLGHTAFCKYGADILHLDSRHSIYTPLHSVDSSAGGSLSLYTTILLANF